MGGNEWFFEFFKAGRFTLREVVLLSGVVFEIEELEADEFARFDFGEMGFLLA